MPWPARKCCRRPEVAQAGNELTGLSVKQSPQPAEPAPPSNGRGVRKARDLATEDEARQRFKSFVARVSLQQADERG